MIAVDTSAHVGSLAIPLGEPDAANYEREIANADHCVMSAVSLLEAGIVIRSRMGVAGLVTLMQAIGEAAIEVVPFDRDLAVAAIDAFGRYGKGIDPSTQLNFGDCAAYALAKTLGVPLLFKGNDFSATDIVSAL